MTRRNNWFACLTLIALFMAGWTHAQQQPAASSIPAASLGLSQPIPVESSITVGNASQWVAVLHPSEQAASQSRRTSPGR